MRALNLFRQLPVWLLGALLCLGSMPIAYAVDDVGLFQLDGNPLDDNELNVLPDDWETLCDPVGGAGAGCNNAGPGPGPNGSAEVFTGIRNDPPNTTIFTGGGSKDKLDISSWLHKNGSVSQKSDITNAYAAAYLLTDDFCLLDDGDPNVPDPQGLCSDVNAYGDPVQEEGDLIIYFGADRLDNEGSTFMGFWFFQDNIKLNPVSPTGSMTGSFDGVHVNGDVLALVNFPQAQNAVPLIQLLVWDTSCTKKDSVTPMPGECAETNLRLLLGESGAGAICEPGGPPQLACATTNEEGSANDPVASPWPYASADGDINEFPFESFFSGGINISQVIPGASGCFSSFMAETRSSESISASLEDFSLDEFQLCAATAVTDIFNETQDTEIELGSSTAVVGDSIHDNVTITGTELGSLTPPDPSSPPDVTFILFSNNTCSPAVDEDEDGFPDGEFPATDANVLNVSTGPLVGGTPDDGIATASSGSFSLTQTGAHSYRAFWDGDENYPGGAVSDCEPFNVIQPQFSIRKEIISCGSADPGNFDFTAQGVTGPINLGEGTTNLDALTLISSLEDGDISGPHSVSPGDYLIDEDIENEDEYVYFYDSNLSGSDCANTSASAAQQTVSLAGDESKTCVFLNVRKPTVTVKKIIDGEGTFDLLVDGTKVNIDDSMEGFELISDYDQLNNDFGEPVVAERSTTLPLENYSTVLNCDDGTVKTWEPDEVDEGNAFDLTGVRSMPIQTLDPGFLTTCEFTNVQILQQPECPVPNRE